MTQHSTIESLQVPDLATVLWTGRSGRRYTMARVEGDEFSLRPTRLYVLAEEGVIRWVGTADDLIADQGSRARFRAAVAEGAQMLSLPSPDDDLARMTLVWDLEGVRRPMQRSAA